MYDVIIVGGGPAGCATALTLNRSNPNKSFLVLDDADPTVFKIGESLPPIASRTIGYLSPTLSDRLLRDTSLGNHARSTGNASAWSSQEIHEQYSITNMFGSSWHLDRALFDESLRDAVRDICSKQVETNRTSSSIIKARFVSVNKEEGMWSVYAEDLESGAMNCYRSKWVVDATGRKAMVARKLGAKTLKRDDLLAFYTLFESFEDDADNRTLIEAVDSGWWYTSQLTQNRRIVVYHTDSDDPSAKLARKPDGFLDLLYNHTSHISQVILTCNYQPPPGAKYPHCTAAGSSILQPICDEAEHWCAVGDSAMAFDPLSSQGIITALNSGCFIGDEICKRLVLESGPEDTDPNGSCSIPNYFEAVGKKYEKEKAYYYRHARFDSVFWMKRRE